MSGISPLRCVRAWRGFRWLRRSPRWQYWETCLFVKLLSTTRTNDAVAIAEASRLSTKRDRSNIAMQATHWKQVLSVPRDGAPKGGL